MRASRSVTLQPMGMPSRSLKPAIERLAFVISGLLAGDQRQMLDGLVEHLRVLLRLADAHVQRDLEEARHLHDARVAEALVQRRDDLGAVALLQARVIGGVGAGHQLMSLPQSRRRHLRTLLPSSSMR